MIELFKDKNYQKIDFHIKPRDFLKNSVIVRHPIVLALKIANTNIKNLSHGQYRLALTRGYVQWSLWRRLRAFLGKITFRFLFLESAEDTQILFSSNGHDDGLSVDVTLYDTKLKKIVKFLPWHNVFISRETAEKRKRANSTLLNMLDSSMLAAGFFAHDDPREKLQAHYRLRAEQ